MSISSLIPKIFSTTHSSNCPETFQEKMRSLQQQQQQHLQANKPFVLISGAGPAGLIRAIESLINGNPTQVVEKRAEQANGRGNIVALKGDAIAILKTYGIYHYLMENGLVYPENRSTGLSVRLEDLETAMKAVISYLTAEPVISYQTQIENILHRPGQTASLTLHHLLRNQQAISSPDVVIVAEGSRSHINELLGNRRVDILPRVPVVAAIMKDARPSITGLPTLFTYISMTVLETARSIYYHALFVFKCCFQKEHIFNPNRTIAGSLVLQVPGQDYIGYGLSRSESQVLRGHAATLRRCQQQLESAQQRGVSEEIERCQQAFDSAKKEHDAYIEYWAKLSVCSANILSVIQYLSSGAQTALTWGSIRPVSYAQIVEIGADAVQNPSIRLGQTAFLITGDALATVDPTTGLGCRTALELSLESKRVIEGLDRREQISELLHHYDLAAKARIASIHYESRYMRGLYRPDAVTLEAAVS